MTGPIQAVNPENLTDAQLPVPMVQGRLRPLLSTGVVRRVWGRSASVRLGLALLLLIVLACVLIPVFWSYSTGALVGVPFNGPSLSHPFGTDDLGRDVFVRTFAAGRLDMGVAAIAVAISSAIGAVLGTAAGAAKNRWFDAVVARLVDVVIAFPYLVVVLVLVVIVGPNSRIGPTPRGAAAILIAFLIVGWTIYARLARAEAMSLRQRDFVVAAEVLGYPRWQILGRHILPRIVPVVVAYAAADFILTMGALASFAFLGAGVQPPTPEWGAMMFEGSTYLQTAWWITVFPGALLALTGFAMSLIADGLLHAND